MNREDDSNYAELYHELEMLRIAALDRCVEAGADPEAIRVLAAAAGIDYKPAKDYGRNTKEVG
jgi:hypothetical protein